MKVSLNWLKDYVTVSESKEMLKETFSTRSQEVDSVYDLVDAKKLVVGYVKSCEAHPNADKLSVCEVDVKEETLKIICGAPNIAKGQHVIVALPGATLPGNFKIKKAKLRGVESNGMICSLSELGIEQKYHQETGIHVISETVEVGDDALKALYFNDEVIELDLTPNRADLLSMHGVAYDVSAMLNQPMHIKTPILKTSDISNPFTVTTKTEDCLSYYGRVIDNISVQPSPLWMRARLIAAGVRPINNVVDITNYVMLETGQPLHAFDYDLVGSEEIVVRLAKPGEKFTTLDDKERTLESNDIVITNGEKPIALGGVMGGSDTEVYRGTNRIFLESATFNPLSIRKTSRRLDMRSESSTRFERGIDPEKTRFALDRACELLAEYASGSVRSGVSYFDNHQPHAHVIEISVERVNKVLGSLFDASTIASILKRLNFNYRQSEQTFYIDAPSRRRDIETYQDIIEEIGRISGYDALPSTLPTTVSKGGLTPYQKLKRSIRRQLTSLGLYEVITYGLMEKEKAHTLSLDQTSQEVLLANPLSENREALTLSPLNGMIDVMSYNVARKQESVHIFEIGKHYETKKETERLAFALTGVLHDASWQKTEPVNFYTLKGLIDAVLNRLNLTAHYERAELKNYHPHQTAKVYIDNTLVGHIGKLHPSYTKEADLKDVYCADLNLELLFELSTKVTRYETLQRFPSINRDIAVVVEKSQAAQTLLDSIKDSVGKHLTDVFVFDVYEGEHIESDKKSLAIRMRFEDKTQTLETQTVDKYVNDLLELLKEKHNATLR